MGLTKDSTFKIPTSPLPQAHKTASTSASTDTPMIIPVEIQRKNEVRIEASPGDAFVFLDKNHRMTGPKDALNEFNYYQHD